MAWVMCFLFCFGTLLLGCLGGEIGSNEQGQIEPIFDDGEEVTLKVYAHRYTWEQFMERYGQQLEERFEHIKLQHYEMSTFDVNEDAGIDRRIEWEREITSLEIDLILGGSPPEVENEEFLIALDAFIAEPGFEADKIPANLLDALRAEDGRIYALAPTFMNEALYYNKELFDQYQVDYPRDYMNWEELFHLVDQFPEQEVTGFYERSPIRLIHNMLHTNKVEIVDQQHINMVNNDAFKDVIRRVLFVYQDVNLEEMLHFNTEEFVGGHVAMSVLPVSDVERRNVAFEWDLVSAPVAPDGSNESVYFGFHNLLSISAGSHHVGAAWEVISYINGEQSAAYFAKQDVEQGMLQDLEQESLWHFPVRIGHFSYDTEKNYAGLYAVRRNDHIVLPYSGPLSGFATAFSGMMYPILYQILDEEISLEQGLIELETQGQAILDEFVQKNARLD